MPRKIRILHIFPSLELGGSQMRLREILQQAPAHQQHMVIALNSVHSSLDGMRDADRPEILEAHPNSHTGGFWARRSAIRAQLRQINPDLMITYNWGAVEWALANRLSRLCPSIHVQDGFNPEEQTGEIPRRKWLRRLAYGGKTKVIVPSFQLAQIARKNWGVSNKRLQIIPNGVDLRKFKASADTEKLAELGISDADKLVVTVAALRPEKNIGRLIEAMRYLVDQTPEAKLLIIGDGVGMAALTMLRDRIGLSDHVIFAGHIDNPAGLIARADICALSSDTEQMPLFILEAMAAAKPIVSTDVGDIARMVAPSNRAQIAGMEAGALLDGMATLLADPALAAEIGENNREKATSDFDKSFMLERWSQAYDTAAC